MNERKMSASDFFGVALISVLIAMVMSLIAVSAYFHYLDRQAYRERVAQCDGVYIESLELQGCFHLSEAEE